MWKPHAFLTFPRKLLSSWVLSSECGYVSVWLLHALWFHCFLLPCHSKWPMEATRRQRKRAGPCIHLSALQRAACPFRREFPVAFLGVLNVCPGLGKASCSSAAVGRRGDWRGREQCEAFMCRGNTRTSGWHPCEQGSRCRPLKTLLPRLPAPWNFLPGECRKASDFLDIYSFDTRRVVQDQWGSGWGPEHFLKSACFSEPGTRSEEWHELCPRVLW